MTTGISFVSNWHLRQCKPSKFKFDYAPPEVPCSESYIADRGYNEHPYSFAGTKKGSFNKVGGYSSAWSFVGGDYVGHISISGADATYSHNYFFWELNVTQQVINGLQGATPVRGSLDVGITNNINNIQGGPGVNQGYRGYGVWNSISQAERDFHSWNNIHIGYVPTAAWLNRQAELDAKSVPGEGIIGETIGVFVPPSSSPSSGGATTLSFGYNQYSFVQGMHSRILNNQPFVIMAIVGEEFLYTKAFDTEPGRFSDQEVTVYANGPAAGAFFSRRFKLGGSTGSIVVNEPYCTGKCQIPMDLWVQGIDTRDTGVYAGVEVDRYQLNVSTGQTVFMETSATRERKNYYLNNFDANQAQAYQEWRRGYYVLTAKWDPTKYDFIGWYGHDYVLSPTNLCYATPSSPLSQPEFLAPNPGTVTVISGTEHHSSITVEQYKYLITLVPLFARRGQSSF